MSDTTTTRLISELNAATDELEQLPATATDRQRHELTSQLTDLERQILTAQSRALGMVA